MSSDHPPHLCAIGGGRADQASGNMQANLLPALLSARGRLSGEARMPQAKARPASEGTCHAGVAGHVAQLALRQAWNLSDQRGHVQSDRLLHITWVASASATGGTFAVGNGQDSRTNEAILCAQRDSWSSPDGILHGAQGGSHTFQGSGLS